MPKAYWVSAYRTISDPDTLLAYNKLAGPAVKAGGGRVLVRGGQVVAHDAGIAERTVLIEFESFDEAVAAHASPAYQEALATLADAVERDFRIVEGVDPLPGERASEVRAVLEAYLDALVQGDLDRIRASFSPDATWTLHGSLPLSGQRTGREAIIDFLTSAGELYVPGTQTFTFGDITAEHDRAVLEWNVRGVGAATGRDYDNDYCGVFIIRDGLIVAVREYLDSQHVRDTLFS